MDFSIMDLLNTPIWKLIVYPIVAIGAVVGGFVGFIGMIEAVSNLNEKLDLIALKKKEE